jgi:mxaK protein
MALSKPRRRFWLCVICGALVALCAWDGYSLWRAERLNRAIADRSIAAWESTLPPVLFAQAYYLQQDQRERERALALYQRVEAEAPSELSLAAKYNRGNLYLQQALALERDGTEHLRLPLVELAKDAYRAVLRRDSTHWDAKYNLERALRLAPEADELAAEELPAPRQAERAVTTMQGRSLGLP